MHEVRRDDARQHAPLVMRLAHEADIAHPQVPKTAVDELRRRTRRRPAEVPRVDERHGEPGAGRVGGDRSSDDATADDEQVEPRRCERLERVGAGNGRGQTRNGFDHAFIPAESVTSTRTCEAPGGTFSVAFVTSPEAAVSTMRPSFRYPSRPALTAAPIDFPETRVTARQGEHDTSTVSPSTRTSSRTGPAEP